MKDEEFFGCMKFYRNQVEQLFQIACAYNTTIDNLLKICRIAAIIDTERSPGFAEKLLINSYSKYLKILERR